MWKPSEGKNRTGADQAVGTSCLPDSTRPWSQSRRDGNNTVTCSKTKGLVNVATKSKEEIARLAAKTIAQKLKDAGVPTDLCWRWYTTGECRWPSCVHNLRHTEQYRGQGGKPDEDQKNEAVAEADGPVPGTKGLNCKKKPQYL